MEVSFLQRLFEYDYWANREALSSLSTVGGDASRSKRFFNHIVGAQRVWLSRVDSSEAPLADAWPTLTLEEARAAVEDLHARWRGLLGQLTPEKLAGDLTFRNTKGQEFNTPIQDVLTHLAMHSVYHRGQVAAAVRDSGGKPAATDYIVYVRKLSQPG